MAAMTHRRLAQAATTFKQPAFSFIHPDDMPDVYAIPGYGRCMEPEIADGSLLAFDKRTQPRVGEIVVLFFSREHAPRYGMPGMIKRLAMPLPPEGVQGLIVVEQLNPRKILTLPTSHVVAVHRCIGRAAGGDGPSYAKVRRSQIQGGE